MRLSARNLELLAFVSSRGCVSYAEVIEFLQNRFGMSRKSVYSMIARLVRGKVLAKRYNPSTKVCIELSPEFRQIVGAVCRGKDNI